jgi:hypothetical protein
VAAAHHAPLAACGSLQGHTSDAAAMKLGELKIKHQPSSWRGVGPSMLCKAAVAVAVENSCIATAAQLGDTKPGTWHDNILKIEVKSNAG